MTSRFKFFSSRFKLFFFSEGYLNHYSNPPIRKTNHYINQQIDRRKVKSKWLQAWNRDLMWGKALRLTSELANFVWERRKIQGCFLSHVFRRTTSHTSHLPPTTKSYANVATPLMTSSVPSFIVNPILLFLLGNTLYFGYTTM